MDKLHAMHQFVQVAEANSFSVAARRMEISPSAISKIITGLESELGFSLFNRSTRRLSLTAAGSAYLQRCRDILEAMEAAENEGKLQSQTRGTLKVGLHPAFRIAFFSDLARFLERHPDIELETRLTNSPSVLLDEGFDVLFRAGPLPDSNLVAQQIGSFELVVGAAPRYLQRYGTPRTPMELEKHRLAIPWRTDDSSTVRWEFVKGMERCSVNIRSCLRVRDGMGLPETVVGGGAISRLYRVAFMPAMTAGLAKPILTDWLCAGEPCYAVFPNARGITPKAAAMVEFVSGLMARTEEQWRDLTCSARDSKSGGL